MKGGRKAEAAAGMPSNPRHQRMETERLTGRRTDRLTDRQTAIPVPDQKGAEEGGTKL